MIHRGGTVTDPRTHADAVGNAAKRLHASQEAAREASDKVARERAEQAQRDAEGERRLPEVGV
jgi:hypothetical protein